MNTQANQHATLVYDFGDDSVSVPFEFEVEKDDTFYLVMAVSLVQYYRGSLSEENVNMVVEMIKDEKIDQDSAFDIAEEDLKTHYEEDARDAFGGFYD